jgi:hypothetical protein
VERFGSTNLISLRKADEAILGQAAARVKTLAAQARKPWSHHGQGFLLRTPRARLILPELREPPFGQRSVARSRLQIAMPKVVRQRSRIMSIISVRMHRERQLRSSTSSLHHPQEPSRRHLACQPQL